jgi:hypothetical protein
MNIKGKVLGDYVIELPVFTSLDYDKALKMDKELFGQWGCSAISKIINGEMVVARSLDLSYSFKPAYIIRTAVKGFNKTVGVSYSPFSGPDFEKSKLEGISEDDALRLAFFTTDILNDKGLYIEGNMRPNQPQCTGIKDCKGTNTKAKLTFSIGALIRFLAERASSVTEAVELANTVNVCGLKHGDLKWGGAYYMADKSGHYGVLEVGDNKLIWNDMARCQTNFYLNNEMKDRAIVGLGLGRYNTLLANVDKVKDEKGMEDLIDLVRYTRSYDPDTCTFDARGELPGVDPVAFKDFGGYLSTKAAFADENKELIMNALRESGHADLAKSIDQRKKEGTAWLSAYQSVVNCNKGILRVKFFEDNNLIFNLKAE